MPCQWITTASVGILLTTCTLTVSPATDRMLGPGNSPLMEMTSFSTQSGAAQA
ncbi:hypothetical protein Mapa_000882 [Marchantia paleacea]|nr:hypothetical protein Mapa_000882 [Marchantia paleacea]